MAIIPILLIFRTNPSKSYVSTLFGALRNTDSKKLDTEDVGVEDLAVEDTIMVKPGNIRTSATNK